ncbi:MAG: ribonuclease III [Thermodesulfovibrionales bacterium]
MTPSKTQRNVEDLEDKLGYFFENKDLLAKALTHKSYYHENRAKSPAYNERLEFLGDSVIGLVVVEYLFLLEEKYDESVLAKMKSYLVCEAVLADIAVSLSLGRYILLGKGEDSTGGRIKKSILSDALEAVIGAVYLDGGFAKAREIVRAFFKERIGRVIEEGELYDYKTELQEKTQLLYGTLPEYRVIEEQGMEHKRVFTVAVFLDGRELGVASGKRKKEAEALAAKEALEKLKG